MPDMEDDLLTEGLKESENELFQNALVDEPAAEPEAVVQATEEQPQPEPEQPQRDAQGRFAAKEAKTEPEPAPAKPDAPAQPDKGEAHVPSWRLREVNEQREAAERRAAEHEARIRDYERRLADLQRAKEPQPEPPDMFADPQGWQRTVVQAQSQALAAQRYEFSEMLARQAHGDERVNQAEKWAEANLGVAERARIANARHPYAELIRIQDERNVLSEIGTDPTAYVNKKLEEALNDPAFLSKALEKARAHGGQSQNGSKPVVQIPPSLSRATSAASAHEDAGDMSDKSLFNYAMK